MPATRCAPFVEVELDGFCVGKTRADERSDRMPRWQETFSIMSTGRQLLFRARLLPSAALNFDDALLIGETTVDLQALLGQGQEGQKCVALGRQNQPTGRLWFTYRPLARKSSSSHGSQCISQSTTGGGTGISNGAIPIPNPCGGGRIGTLPVNHSPQSGDGAGAGYRFGLAGGDGFARAGPQPRHNVRDIGRVGGGAAGIANGVVGTRRNSPAASRGQGADQATIAQNVGCGFGGHGGCRKISGDAGPYGGGGPAPAPALRTTSPRPTSPLSQVSNPSQTSSPLPSRVQTSFRTATTTSARVLGAASSFPIRRILKGTACVTGDASTASDPLPGRHKVMGVSEPKRLNISEEGGTNIVELMQSKDKLKEFATRPFKELPSGSRLDFAQFTRALKDVLKEIHMSVPQEPKMRQLFDKHCRGAEGMDEGEFEALLFRLLCFLRASSEVKISTGTGASEQERDKRWRQDFIQKNPLKFHEVYDVENQLGKGNFGVVYMVTHKTQRNDRNEKHVRVSKHISKEQAKKAGTTEEKVREEFAVLKALDHPHVLRIFEDFEDDEKFYIIMEPCRGGDLQEYVKTLEPMDAITYERWVAKVMQHTLSALAYCHSKGVIHKDLKPENVMLSTAKHTPIENMHVVVVDFGLAEMFDNPTDRSSVISGTPPYMSPEVWRGNFSKSCDIWSAGCMLFFLLSGRLPFMASKLSDFPKAVQQEPEWEMMGGATSWVQALCKKMLSKLEHQRPSAQVALRDTWFETVGGISHVGGAQALAPVEINSLMSVQERTPFEKFVERLVATQIDASQQLSVNEAFRRLDSDGNGLLSRDELRQGLGQFSSNQNHLDAVIAELDIGKTGAISYSEFLAGVINLRGKRPEEQDKLLWVAWRQFCPDEHGRVKMSTIQNALSSRGMTVADLPEEFLAALNKESSQYITFVQFKELLLVDNSGRAMRALAGEKARGGKLVRWIMNKFQN
eukprot:TRINITY_DN34592_c0_g1_i1.p1 TRINITY_DN34592_c0_g1~~TRINITY_DN34592_c0_g1_i1.p1  ORF type:complete len:1001 (-),score=159.40 TRINITY_DN34592_c0_g1_i1:66-2963(-)